MLSYNTDGMIRQHFVFKDSIMDYIFKNLKPVHLTKLYQCCKYFYAKFRRNIIRHLEIVPDGEKETLDPTKTVICVSNHFLSTIKDFWLTDSYTNHGCVMTNHKLLIVICSKNCKHYKQINKTKKEITITIKVN